MIEITLPWPDKRLSPNARVHWLEKAEAAKGAREAGYYLMRNTSTIWVRDGIPDEIVSQYTFHPPDRRRRDQDNYSAMMKSYQDGVCDAMGIDDSCFQMAAPVWGDVTPGGKVVLTLEEME